MFAMKVGQNANKKQVLEELLELGMVLVAIDARVPAVDVPDHLGIDPQLRLNLSYRFGRPMQVDAWGISADLTFGGVPHGCRFPWDAIFLIVSHVNGESYLFPDHVPRELLNQAAGEQAMMPADAPSVPTRPKLSLVREEEPDLASEVPQQEGSGAAGEDADAPFAASSADSSANAKDLDKQADPVDAPDEEDSIDDAPKTPPRRGHLRLVK
jgi:stringent starvation protein B